MTYRGDAGVDGMRDQVSIRFRIMSVICCHSMDPNVEFKRPKTCPECAVSKCLKYDQHHGWYCWFCGWKEDVEPIT